VVTVIYAVLMAGLRLGSAAPLLQVMAHHCMPCSGCRCQSVHSIQLHSVKRPAVTIHICAPAALHRREHSWGQGVEGDGLHRLGSVPMLQLSL
jgi:hypothetical protein